jgi:D-glycerate 3-kinase
MKLETLVQQVAKHLMSLAPQRPLVLGVSGGQGVGKTTFCEALSQYLHAAGVATQTLSLDDFYLSRRQREDLAAHIHPLCKTRGVPGTHDILRLHEAMVALQSKQRLANLRLPVFSKSLDDVLPPAQWLAVDTQPEIILLEGWCVGAQADFISPHPQTDWERAHDSEGVWKQWSQTQAAAYADIWAACDCWMLMRQDNFEAVVDSRWAQEQDNAAASGIWQFETREAVAQFCAHYESWTLGIWQALPRTCDFVIGRDEGFTYRHWLDEPHPHPLS